MSVSTAVHTSASPWSARQRAVLGVLIALGAAGLIAGYAGVSGTVRVSRQVPWLNLAGVALLISGVGVLAFLTSGRRQVGRRRLSLFGDLGDPVAFGPVAAGGTGDRVAVAGTSRYHRGDCEFVAGKAVAPASVAAHQRAGRQPCGICLGGEVTGE